jgi:hypothetical protein
MDLYEILGLTHGASLGEIKRAYRRLARRYHPDINPGDRAAEGRFRQIQLHATLGEARGGGGVRPDGRDRPASARAVDGFEDSISPWR